MSIDKDEWVSAGALAKMLGLGETSGREIVRAQIMAGNIPATEVQPGVWRTSRADAEALVRKAAQ